MSPELTLVGYIAWTLFLVVSLEVWRIYLTITQGRVATSFKADGTDTSERMARLCAAYYNCAENFPVFGGVLLLAVFHQWGDLTEPLGVLFLAGRVVQSVAHISSGSVLAINIRALAYFLQLGIALYWLFTIVGRLL